MLGEARGAFVLLAALALGAVRCQAVLGVDAYDFEPASEDAHPLAKAPDAGAGLDAGPALDGFEPEDGGGASPGALAADAAAAPDGPVVLPCEGPGCTPPACDGCVVGERCVPAGQALPFSPCLVCDPAQSASGYSIGVGNACGEQASACSAPDTCDAEGFCAPNDLPAGTPCGDATGPACDAADTCDGAGACVDRRAGDGTPCEDGLFCTTGDQCLAGACASGGPLPCGDNQQCAEDADACVCSGCVVDGACLPAGARSGTCFVCDPRRNTSAFSPDEGAVCGNPDGECFGVRTCNSSGDCVSRPLGAGAACGSPFGSDCSGPDSCDGNGFCSPNDAADGEPCSDGLICTGFDSCQGGTCFSGDPVFCGNGLECNELDGCSCPSGFSECADGTCRRFCSGGEIP